MNNISLIRCASALLGVVAWVLPIITLFFSAHYGPSYAIGLAVLLGLLMFIVFIIATMACATDEQTRQEREPAVAYAGGVALSAGVGFLIMVLFSGPTPFWYDPLIPQWALVYTVPQVLCLYGQFWTAFYPRGIPFGPPQAPAA